jgi:hypothetical protein
VAAAAAAAFATIKTNQTKQLQSTAFFIHIPHSALDKLFIPRLKKEVYSAKQQKLSQLLCFHHSKPTSIRLLIYLHNSRRLRSVEEDGSRPSLKITPSLAMARLWTLLPAVMASLLLLAAMEVGGAAQEGGVAPPLVDLEQMEEWCRNFTTGNLAAREFYSPMYPFEYPANIKCFRIVEADIGNFVRIDFRDVFRIEPPSTAGECKYDYLEIRDGEYGYSPLIGELESAGSIVRALDKLLRYSTKYIDQVQMIVYWFSLVLVLQVVLKKLFSVSEAHLSRILSYVVHYL